MSVEVRGINWLTDRKALLTIENAAFAPDMRSDKKDLRKRVTDGFGLVIYNNGEPSAYALGIPLEKVEYGGCQEDPNRDLGNSIYMESLAIVPGESPLMLRRLVRNMRELIINSGIHRITMHAETDSHWYQFLTGLGARELNRFDNWLDWGKTFAYLELNI